jgi:hypothetical protein
MYVSVCSCKCVAVSVYIKFEHVLGALEKEIEGGAQKKTCRHTRARAILLDNIHGFL